MCNMGAAAATKTYNIHVTVQMKRSKDEVELVKSELERLHSYIEKKNEVDWAKKRIEDVMTLTLLPNADQIKNAVKSSLEDEEESKADTNDFNE
jgi:hypothetical protein